MEIQGAVQQADSALAHGRINFLHFPTEIRLFIYHHALVEPPRWRKRHIPPCPYAPTSTKVTERPPFIMHNSTYRYPEGPNFQHADYVPMCSCAKRHSLNLLLVCRQVNAEAAPIFWTENIFHFWTGHIFARNVGQQLRDAYRKQLRHVVVMRLMDMEDYPHRPGSIRYGKGYGWFWETVLQCEGLVTLETSIDTFAEVYEPLDTYTRYVQAVVAKLTRLENFRLSVLQGYRFVEAELTKVAGFDSGEPPVIVWRMFADLPFQKGGPMSLEEVRAVFRSCFTDRSSIYNVERVLCHELDIVYMTQATDWTDISFDDYPMETVDRFIDNPLVTVELDDGTKVEVELMGLPISKKVETARNRERDSNNR